VGQKAPFWGQVPDYVRADLSAAAYDHKWFDDESDEIRQTVLNLYVKLSGMDMWKHVMRRDITTPTPKGCLEFLTRSVVTLKADLKNRPEFTVPDDSLVAWECREKRSSFALHFKHFGGWTNQAKVQAHIDRVGLGFGGKWSPPIIGPLVMGVPHLRDYCQHGWQEVFEIRDALLKQGWDPEGLSGISATWLCGARSCPSHSQPEHRCANGLWYCGCRQPACPGWHPTLTDRCRAGSKWHCGARQCLTHARAEDVCPVGVWYCGRKQPPCPGHNIRKSPCDSDTVFLYVS
jgi:hypothetical protein